MHDKLQKQIGLRIKELREASGYTQIQVAGLLLKSIETISNFERGKVMPGIPTLNAFCGKIGITLENFFSRVGITSELSNREKSLLRINEILMTMDDEDLEYVILQLQLIIKYSKKHSKKKSSPL